MLDAQLRHGPVVVEVTGTWCGNCRRLRPVVRDVASSAGAALVEVDVEQEPDLVGELAIRSVPTLVALRDGVEIGRLVGLQSADAVEGLFAAALHGDADTVRSKVPSWLLGARAAVAVLLALVGMVLGSVPLAIVGVAVLVWALAGVVRR